MVSTEGAAPSLSTSTSAMEASSSSASASASSPSRPPRQQQQNGPPLSPSSGRGTRGFHHANHKRGRSRRPATASSILQAAVVDFGSSSNSGTTASSSELAGIPSQRGRASSISIQTKPAALAYSLAESGPASAPPRSPTFSHRPKPGPMAHTFELDMSGVQHHSDGEEGVVSPKKKRRNSLLSLELFTSKSVSSDEEEEEEGASLRPIPRSPSINSIISNVMDGSGRSSSPGKGKGRDDWTNSARRWPTSLGRSGSQYLQSASPYLRAGLNELYDIFNMEGETGTVEPSLLPTTQFPQGRGMAALAHAGQGQGRKEWQSHIAMSREEGSVATTCSSSASRSGGERARQASGDTVATTPEDAGSSSCSESALASGERPFSQQQKSASATFPISRSDNKLQSSSLSDERVKALLRRSHSARVSASARLEDARHHCPPHDSGATHSAESSLSRRNSKKRRFGGRASGHKTPPQLDLHAHIKTAASLDAEPSGQHDSGLSEKRQVLPTDPPMQASEARVQRCPSPRRVAAALLMSAVMLSAFCVCEVSLHPDAFSPALVKFFIVQIFLMSLGVLTILRRWRTLMALTSRFIRAHALAQLLISFSAMRSLSSTASFHQQQQSHGHTFGSALEQLHPRSLTSSFVASPQAHAHDTQVGNLRNQTIYTLAFIAQALLPLLLVIWLQFYAGRSLGVLSATAFKTASSKRDREELGEQTAEKEAEDAQRNTSSDQGSKAKQHLLTPFSQPLTASPTSSPNMLAVNEGQKQPISPLAPPLSPRSSLGRFNRHKKSSSASQIYIAEDLQRQWLQMQPATDTPAPPDAPFSTMDKEGAAKERKSV